MLIKGKRGIYGGTEDFSVEVPDDTVFIYKDGIIGDGLTDGHNHYLGCTKCEVESSYCITVYKVSDLNLILLRNVLLESEIPIISGEEFYNKFDLGNYYIYDYTKPDFFNRKYFPSRLISISRITGITSPYSIDLFEINLNSWMSIDNRLVKVMRFTENCHIDAVFTGYSILVETKKNTGKEYIEAINEVLSYSDLGISVDVSDHPCVKQTDQ